MKYMEYNTNLFSSLSFWWVNWLLALGYTKHLELSDLGEVPERHQAKFNHERFRKAFMEETVGFNIRKILFCGTLIVDIGNSSIGP